MRENQSNNKMEKIVGDLISKKLDQSFPKKEIGVKKISFCDSTIVLLVNYEYREDFPASTINDQVAHDTLFIIRQDYILVVPKNYRYRVLPIPIAGDKRYFKVYCLDEQIARLIVKTFVNDYDPHTDEMGVYSVKNTRNKLDL